MQGSLIEPEMIELSADDDPSGQGAGAPSYTRGQHERARQTRQAPAPRLLSAPVVHRIQFCRHCGIGQAVKHAGPNCQHCGRPLA